MLLIHCCCWAFLHYIVWSLFVDIYGTQTLSFIQLIFYGCRADKCLLSLMSFNFFFIRSEFLRPFINNSSRKAFEPMGLFLPNPPPPPKNGQFVSIAKKLFTFKLFLYFFKKMQHDTVIDKFYDIFSAQEKKLYNTISEMFWKLIVCNPKKKVFSSHLFPNIWESKIWMYENCISKKYGIQP